MAERGAYLRKNRPRYTRTRRRADRHIVAEACGKTKDLALRGSHVHCRLSRLPSRMGAPVTEVKSSKATARDGILLFKRPLAPAGILPWKSPFFLIARKWASGFGNGQYHRRQTQQQPRSTATSSPKSSMRSDCPQAFNVVNGPGAEIGNALSAHPQVDMVSLTYFRRSRPPSDGSRLRQHHQSFVELGGKAPPSF